MNSTPFFAMKPSSNSPMPAARIRNLEDGSVQITLGALKGYVSSHHLITPKIHQMQDAYRKAHPHLDL
jgi:hypothetical protein